MSHASPPFSTAAVNAIAQALSDEHIRSWGDVPVPLAELCDAAYWRRMATVALEAQAAGS